jgi:hypothetical protein
MAGRISTGHTVGWPYGRPMRANGVRDLQVHCTDRNYHHQVTISVDDFADALVVIDFARA